MKCEHCGCEIPERAVICPDCGAILPRQSEKEKNEQRQTAPSSSFSMPFLSASADTVQDSEKTEDPELHKQKAEEKRFRLIRRTIFLCILAAVLLVGILYGVFFGGYKLAAYRYVKGVDHCSGRMYLSLVPDAYMDYLENTYDTTRRDVKEMLSDYFTYWNANYGEEGSMSYTIDRTQTLDEETIVSLEQELQELYRIDVDIKKAVEADITIDDGGTKASESATFVKIGMKWCCMEAMEDIDFVVVNDGYDVW